jgi:c-di-GMP-related signal transduction protein
MPTPPPFAATASVEPGKEGASMMIARQAIMNAQHSVIGYELFNRSLPGSGHTPASDVSLVFNALSHAGTEDLIGNMLIFVNCTHNSLAGGHLELIDPEKVVLELPPLDTESVEEIESRAATLGELRKRGFHLAFNHTVLRPAYASWLPLADYIKLDLVLIPANELPGLIAYAQSHTQAEVIAEKVESEEQFNAVLARGVQLFQGYWFAKPALVTTKLVTPSQASTVQLINLVRKQASTTEIEEVLKKDAGLAFNLMRLINSSGFGLSREITSFRQAVMLLGLQKMFRWAALLLTASRAGGPPSSVGHMAVVRGRLMELLALEGPHAEEADNAFVVGIFSLLDVMIGMPMEKALELLSLPPAVADALLHRKGPYAPYLELTIACETGDDAAFSAASETLHLSSQQVNWAHLQALAWSDQLASAES